MPKQLLAFGFAAGALALLILGLGRGEVWAQQPDLFFDFKPEEVVRLQINEIDKLPVSLSRQNTPAIWRRSAAEITATLKVIQAISSTTPSEIKVFLAVLEIHLLTERNEEYILRVSPLMADKTVLIGQTRPVSDVPESRVYVGTEQDLAKLRTQLDKLRRQITEPPTSVPPTLTASPKPPVTLTLAPPTTSSPTRPPVATETPITTPTATFTPIPTQTPNPIEGIIQTAQARPGLTFVGVAGCFGGFIVLLIVLLALWLRRAHGASPRGTPYLELESTGLRLDLTRDTLTLGRGANCDLRLAENLPGVDTVSRQHARLTKRDTRWIVVDGIADDQPSTNGVYVNGKRTLENYLSEDDEIAFGELKLRFHLPTTGIPMSQGGAR